VPLNTPYLSASTPAGFFTDERTFSDLGAWLRDLVVALDPGIVPDWVSTLSCGHVGLGFLAAKDCGFNVVHRFVGTAERESPGSVKIRFGYFKNNDEKFHQFCSMKFVTPNLEPAARQAALAADVLNNILRFDHLACLPTYYQALCRFAGFGGDIHGSDIRRVAGSSLLLDCSDSRVSVLSPPCGRVVWEVQDVQALAGGKIAVLKDWTSLLDRFQVSVMVNDQTVSS